MNGLRLQCPRCKVEFDITPQPLTISWDEGTVRVDWNPTAFTHGPCEEA